MADIISTLVPFLFVLALTYGALELSGVFKKKQVNTIIALAMAFYTMTNTMLLNFIDSVLPYAIFMVIIIFFLGFIMKFFQGKKEGDRDYTLIILVLFLFLIVAANYGLGFIENMVPGISQEELMTGIGIAVIMIILYSVYRLWNKGGPGT